MGETLTQQRRVSDEGFRVVKLCQVGRNHMVLIPPYVDGTIEGSTANSVPAAAVIRGVRALFGFTGRKERVGGLLSQV